MKTLQNGNLTQVATRRREMESNREKIMREQNYDLLEYTTLIFELGCIFLEQHCTESNAHYLKRHPRYWKWFRNEFFHFEKDYIMDCEIIQRVFKGSKTLDFSKRMTQLLSDTAFKASFSEFIRLINR